MLEVFTRPEHQDSASMRALGCLITTALHDHYDTYDGLKVSHLGVTDSLVAVLPDLLKQHRVRGIHTSCESDRIYSDEKNNQKFKIICIKLTEKNSDYVQFHLSYLCQTGETFQAVASLIAELITQTTGEDVEQLVNSPNSLRFRYKISK